MSRLGIRELIFGGVKKSNGPAAEDRTPVNAEEHRGDEGANPSGSIKLRATVRLLDCSGKPCTEKKEVILTLVGYNLYLPAKTGCTCPTVQSEPIHFSEVPPNRHLERYEVSLSLKDGEKFTREMRVDNPIVTDGRSITLTFNNLIGTVNYLGYPEDWFETVEDE